MRRYITRERTPENSFDHKLVKIVNVTAMEYDGSDFKPTALNEPFKNGLFVRMSTDRTFHFYRLENIIPE